VSETVKVRIAIAVDREGKWAAYGFSRTDGSPANEEAWEIVLDIVDDGEARYWVTAELPVPEDADVVGSVETIA
jgi:hypothetical protein